MILKQAETNLNERIGFLMKELQNYKRDRSTLLPLYVEQRLNKSYDSYQKELEESISYIQKEQLAWT